MVIKNTKTHLSELFLFGLELVTFSHLAYLMTAHRLAGSTVATVVLLEASGALATSLPFLLCGLLTATTLIRFATRT